MRLPSFRLLLVVASVASVLVPAATRAAATERTNERGIVQSIDAQDLELRALDGTVTSFTVAPTTRVRVNGQKAPLRRIRPGYVAIVSHRGDRIAVLIRAFGKPVVTTRRGVVASLDRRAITLGSDAGPITIPLDGRTMFRFRGRPGRPGLAQPGALVVVKYVDGSPAKTVNVLKRARA
jgi:hypothetical protein